ncbi:MAG TPA: hypothetical protein VGO47_01190 [Chlamydiales bacterium]|jgi:hypothetical protein|nr:hypothetical protein [Chlamydiales bacterium]
MDRIKVLKALLKKLPLCVPVAKPTDNISLVLAADSEDEDTGIWGTYNRTMDRLFGVDCKKDGRFVEFKCGKSGLDAVIKYAEGFFKKEGFPVELGLIKINALIEEAEYYMYVLSKS